MPREEVMRVDLIITRHPGLLEFLLQEGVLVGSVPVLAHAKAEDLRGKVVIGVLPLHLAAEADLVIEAQLDLTPEMRGKELSADEVRRVFRGFRAYRVEPADIPS